MPQNWNLGQIPDLRNQLVAASWDHKIDQVVVKLENMFDFSTNYHLIKSECRIWSSFSSLLTFSRSGISSLEVTSPISFRPTLSGMASVITYNYIQW